jgi:hypothetical protein
VVVYLPYTVITPTYIRCLFFRHSSIVEQNSNPAASYGEFSS